jgi:hypothetical protein
VTEPATGGWQLGARGWGLGTGCLAVALIPAPPAHSGLSEGPRLAAVYDSMLDARFDRIDEQLAATCPPAPAEACAALRPEAVWWQILVEPDSRALDARLNALAAAAIARAKAWTEREPRRAEAWFYLAGSYTPLVQLRVLRGERLAAARDGSRIKEALERSLQLDPDLADAHLGIGLYKYYAAVAPMYARFLRWLLMLPGGDRAGGLRDVLLARDHAVLLRGEADFQLHEIYLWYENRSRDALALLQSLDDRYPENPIFLERIAGVHDTYFHDLDASIAAWERLRDRARAHRVYAARTIEARAEAHLRQLIARRGKK